MSWRRCLAAIALLFPLACTTTPDQHQYLPPPNSGGTSGHMPSGTLVVAITGPTDGTILAVNSDVVVTATADVQGGTDYVDTTSVTAKLTPAGGGATSANGLLLSSGGDVYSGKLSLGNVPGGMYDLTVAARSSSGMQTTAQVTIKIDAGPVIKVISPKDGNAYSGSMTIDLTVDSGAYALDKGPNATIAGMPIVLTPPDANIPAYRATVAFGPTTPPPPGVQALPPLSGKQLFDVQVTNTNGVKAEARIVFVIDTDGPSITATTPTSGDVVGGVIHISAAITDPSGVLDSSVVAVIANEETTVFELPLTPEGSGIYDVVFDTNNLTPCPEPPASGLCVVFPTISFRAVDLVGNQRVVSYGFAIDNVAPVADLDPPLMRQRSLQMDGYECSFKFDPLSLNQEIGDMPDDKCMVPQVFDLRARIEDDGNRASEVKVTPISLVDPDNTSVFIMPASNNNQPLVVDRNGDGRCDEVNPLLVPTSPTVPPTSASGILQIRLAPVPPTGRANFLPDPTVLQDVPAAPCIPGTSKAPPRRLCDSFEQPTIAIGYAFGQPAIWSVEPIDSVFHCLGNQVDTLANKIPEGWACIAVQTRDKAGNQSVSVPMRVYVKYDATGGFCPQPPASAGPPPTCTGSFDPATNTATLGSCSSRSFPRELRYYCAPGDC